MKVGRAFALLVLAQASHSVEEYVGGLINTQARWANAWPERSG